MVDATQSLPRFMLKDLNQPGLFPNKTDSTPKAEYTPEEFKAKFGNLFNSNAQGDNRINFALLKHDQSTINTVKNLLGRLDIARNNKNTAAEKEIKQVLNLNLPEMLSDEGKNLYDMANRQGASEALAAKSNNGNKSTIDIDDLNALDHKETVGLFNATPAILDANAFVSQFEPLPQVSLDQPAAVLPNKAKAPIKG